MKIQLTGRENGLTPILEAWTMAMALARLSESELERAWGSSLRSEPFVPDPCERLTPRERELLQRVIPRHVFLYLAVVRTGDVESTVWLG